MNIAKTHLHPLQAQPATRIVIIAGYIVCQERNHRGWYTIRKPLVQPRNDPSGLAVFLQSPVGRVRARILVGEKASVIEIPALAGYDIVALADRQWGISTEGYAPRYSSKIEAVASLATYV